MEVDSGILLSKIKYCETSLILSVFTKENGTQSYLFLGGNKKQKQGHALMPFSFFSFNYFGKGELKKIANIETNNTSYSFDPIKNCVALFLSEILNKSIRLHPADLPLYQFLENSLSIFHQSNVFTYYPHWFLISLTRYLGFFPNQMQKGKYFDLLEGHFVGLKPNHPNFADENSSFVLKQFLGTKFDELHELKYSNNERNKLLKLLIEYYKIHIEGLNEIQSLEILETVFYD